MVTFRTTLGTRSLVSAAWLGVLAGCLGCSSATEPDTLEHARTESSPLYRLPTVVWSKWTNNTVPICYTPAAQGHADYGKFRRKVMKELQRTWAAVTVVDPVYYDNCPSVANAVIDFDDTKDNSCTWGYTSPGSACNLEFSYVLDSANLHTIPHEFGHVLGFEHESRRQDYTTSTARCPQGVYLGGNTYGTAANDSTGILACAYGNPWQTGLSAWDERGIMAAYGNRVPAFSPLSNWHNTSSGNYQLTVAGSDLPPTGYLPEQVEGWGYSIPSVSGARQLYSYHHSTTGESAAGDPLHHMEMVNGGYTLQGILAYVYTSQQPGTVELASYRKTNASGGYSYLVTTNPTLAANSGYSAWYSAGWVFQDRPYEVLQNWKATVSGGTEYLTTAANSELIEQSADSFYSAEGAVLKYQVNGTVPLDTYRNNRSQYTYTSQQAPGAPYYKLRNEGYVFASSINGMAPLYDYYQSTSDDHVASVRSPWCTGTGCTYYQNGTMGYVFPLLRAAPYQAFLAQTATGLHETDSTYEFAAQANRNVGDLVVIKKSATGTNHTEMHVLSAASNFQTFVKQIPTGLAETGSNFRFLVSADGDLYAIKKSQTGSGHTEVHVLSWASNFQSFSKHVATALEETGANFDFVLAPDNDLVAIKKNGTGTGSTEIHVLSAASNYQAFTVHTGTPLPETDSTWEFAMIRNRDLYAIKKASTTSKSTEVYVLASPSYQSYALQTRTALHETNSYYNFTLGFNHDLYAVKRARTNTQRTELYILDANTFRPTP